MSEPAEYQPQQPAQSEQATQMLQHLREVSEAMRDTLDACRKHDDAPKVEAVHHLRTGTRRVEATLETLAREAGARGLGKAAEEARQRWLRQLKKVRRAAGMVRDLDVHRELLADNFLPEADNAPGAVARELASVTPSPAAGSGGITAVIQQARALDAWLKSHRSDAAEVLCSTLDDHAARLLVAEEQFMAAVTKRPVLSRRAPRPASLLALEDYLRLMDAMPLLDRENLHDFRKGAKKARYVAESDDTDPAAGAMAKAIKRVQDAIGEWHDWDVVRDEAREALDGGGVELEQELQSRTEHAYERALHITAAMGRRFIGEWQALPPRRARSPRVERRKSS